MWFHICFPNHPPMGVLTISDMRDSIVAGLTELGHKVTFDENNFAPGAINIIFDNYAPDFPQALLRSKLTYGIISTEVFDGKGLNWKRDDWWKKRWKYFKKLAKNALFIWATDKNAISHYTKKFAPTSYFEPGYSDLLLPKIPATNPDIDFAFFGVKTPHREALISRLKKHSHVVWPDHIVSMPELDALISRTKIGLSLKLTPVWPWPSGSRLSRLLMASRGIAAEYTEYALCLSLGDLIPVSPKDVDFVDFAFAQLSGDWQSQAAERLEIFKQTIPMRKIAERMIDETFVSSRHRVWEKDASDTGARRDLGDFHPPRLLESGSFYNIVHYQKKYFVVPHRLGKIDLRNKSDVRRHRLKGETTLEEAQTVAEKMPKQRQESGANLPQLIKTISEYNIVLFQGKYFVIPHRLGKIDLRKESDVNRSEIESLATLEEAQDLVEKRLKEERWQHPPQLIKKVRQCNIVLYQEKYFVVPRHLGSIDLDDKACIERYHLESMPTLQEAKRLIIEKR